MPLELDHVFICCSPGAPEADALTRLGLAEGSPNTHPGQGTANRRFFFENAYLELLWVCEPTEARSHHTRRTRLWERWSQRAAGASPFGLVFRPTCALSEPAPFATWAYRPKYLPAGLAIEFAKGVSLEEPELVYLPFLHRSGAPAGEPTDHSLPFRRVLGATIGLPGNAYLSRPSSAVHSEGLVTYHAASAHLLELTLLASEQAAFDLRPTLPLVLRGVVQDAA